MRQFVNEKQVFESWSPILTKTTNITDKDKLTWMSLVAQNQRLYEDRLNLAHVNPEMNINGMGAISFPGDPSYTYSFANQSAGSGDKPYSLLPIAMQVASKTIGLDLVPVVPMQGPFGMLQYIDFTYAGGKLNTKEAPLYIKVRTSTVTGGEELFVPGTTFYVNEGSNSTNTFAFTYVDKAYLTGESIFKVVPTTAAGALLDIGAPASTNVTDALNVSGLYTSAAGSTLVATFEGNPELVKALEDHIPAFVGRAGRLGDSVTNAEEPYLREEGESTPENLMGLGIKTKSVSAQTYQIAAAVTRDQVDDLRLYGIDVMAQLENLLISEITRSLDRLILNRLFKMGATSHTKWFANTGENFNVNFGSTSAPVYLGAGLDGNAVDGMVTRPVSMNLLGGENIETMQRRVLTMVSAASNAIHNHTNRSGADYIVTNLQLATLFQNISGYTSAPYSNTITQDKNSLYNLGTVAGLNIYVDPKMKWSDNRILVGRRGVTDSTGVVFMPYLMAQSVTVLPESTMAPKISVRSRFAVVDAGHYPEDNYITLKIDTGDVMNNLLL